MIINQEFANLVQEYLTDGIISPTERKVLLKKAVAMGIDEDEAVCYIEAQEQKVQQKLEEERINEKGRKCPHCHQIIDQFSDVCPICNSPLTPQLTEKFNTLLKNLEDALYNLKTGKNIDGAIALIDQYTREAKLNFGNHKKVLAILGEIDTESKRVAENNAVNEIITNLEEALIVLKSGQDINVAKAIIDRYARQAKTDYADNVKVCKLLAEIEVEAKNAEAKAKKAAVVGAIAKHWKTILAIVAVVFVIGMIVKACQPGPADDPQLCIEMVNNALASDNVGEAEALCAAFFAEHNSGYKDIKAIDPAYDAIIRYQTRELNDLIVAGDFDAALDYLSGVNIQSGISHPGTANVVDKYDALFSKLINAYVRNNDLDGAEEAALIWKSKIGNDMSWVDASCYKLLRSKYQQAGRDFSPLKSSCDYLAD